MRHISSDPSAKGGNTVRNGVRVVAAAAALAIAVSCSGNSDPQPNANARKAPSGVTAPTGPVGVTSPEAGMDSPETLRYKAALRKTAQNSAEYLATRIISQYKTDLPSSKHSGPADKGRIYIDLGYDVTETPVPGIKGHYNFSTSVGKDEAGKLDPSTVKAVDVVVTPYTGEGAASDPQDQVPTFSLVLIRDGESDDWIIGDEPYTYRTDHPEGGEVIIGNNEVAECDHLPPGYLRSLTAEASNLFNDAINNVTPYQIAETTFV